MRALRVSLFAGLMSSVSCTPMIENGRDHRHDPHFREGEAPTPGVREA